MAGIVVKPRSRIFHGHDWVYASEIAKTFGDPAPGEVVSLKDFRDRPLGSAIFNPNSQIVARRISRRRQDLDADFFRRRIGRAAEFRERLPVDSALCRLVWSESDGLPGLVVDRYGAHLVVQLLTLAMHQRRETIRDVLVDLLSPASIALRNDAPMLKAEGIDPEIALLHGEAPGTLEVEAAGVVFLVDPLDGQKTGLYLDQLDNHAAVAALARGRRVLDCFCNQGGFALACAKAGAASVVAVDSSPAACAAARANAERNGVEIEVVEANAFDFLRAAPPDCDLVVLDPPSFTRNKKSLAGALRGYKEIHLRSLKLLGKGGLLSTYCCSHHATREIFRDNLLEAAIDAKSTLRLVAEHRQRPDHPVLPGIPETEYLKGLTVEIIPSW
jgi:23S rRNA (cytosine1962-C5)-methyltransferase